MKTIVLLVVPPPPRNIPRQLEIMETPRAVYLTITDRRRRHRVARTVPTKFAGGSSNTDSQGTLRGLATRFTASIVLSGWL